MPTTVEKALLPAELRGAVAPGAYNLEQMYRFAQICQQSGLFADVTDAAQAFVKIARGQELGLSPMMAMSAFDIIQKRLFVKPSIIAAKINSCGYGRYTVLVQTAEECVIRFARKVQGKGWEDCPEVRYTYAEATSHGLVNRSPHWKASPAHMLYQRCMGRGGLMYFPELLAGLEPPPDDTPIGEAQHQQNVIDLYGDPHDPTAPAPRNVTPQKTAEDAPGQANASGEGGGEHTQSSEGRRDDSGGLSGHTHRGDSGTTTQPATEDVQEGAGATSSPVVVPSVVQSTPTPPGASQGPSGGHPAAGPAPRLGGPDLFRLAEDEEMGS